MKILNDKNKALTASTIAVYMVLLYRSNHNKRCKISISSLEKECHCSRSTICRNLNKLEELQYIKRESAENQENEYIILK